MPIRLLFIAFTVFAPLARADCSGFPGCLYQPRQVSFIEIPQSLSYSDIGGETRTINLHIRQPNLQGPLPVMIWSHGGAEGHTNAATSLQEWSEATAHTGYLTISIAHTPRDTPSRSRLCAALGITRASDCEVFKYLNWDRPHDIRRVLDELDSLSSQGPLQGRIDLTRIAVGGHSAGSGGTLSVAGAVRLFNGTPYSFADRRPVAFLAFSPQGPTSEGFFDTDFGKPDTSWDPLDRPLLVGTGDGDSSCDPPGDCIPGSETPYGRRTVFQRAPEGSKYLLYLHDAEAYHGLFALDEGCVAKGLTPQKCEAFSSWLKSTALAFLDAHVKQEFPAQVWLRAGFIRQASNNVGEWRLR